MKAKLNLLFLLFFSPVIINAQYDCDYNFNIPNCYSYVLLTPDMFSYPSSSSNDDPAGPSGVGNLADEFGLVPDLVSANGVGPYPITMWNDLNFSGVLDFGTETTVETIFITVAANTDPNGILFVYAGDANGPDYNQLVMARNFDNLECPMIYFNPVGSISTQFLYFDRAQGLETVTEIAICGYETPIMQEGVSISGSTETRCGVAVPGARVILTEFISLVGGGSQVIGGPVFTTTNANGYYEFTGLTPGHNYIVEMDKNDELASGVNQNDLIAVQNHILFIQLLNSNYELLAADVNDNLSINVTDLTLMQFLLSGQLNDFTLNGGVGWQFVRTNYIFPPGTFSNDLLNSRTFIDVTTDITGIDFTAVKNGDIDCSYTAPGSGGGTGNDDGRGRRSRDTETFLSNPQKMSVSAQPNPFRGVTNLTLELTQEGPVTISIYDLLGQKIFSDQQTLDIGTHIISLDQIPETASGILPYVIEQNGEVISGKLTRIK